MTIEKLSNEAVAKSLAQLPNWKHENNSICRSFKFDDFVQAFGFMTQVAFLAEKANHHPDWSNSYNRVDVVLSTHEAQGLTERDFALAGDIEALALAYNF